MLNRIPRKLLPRVPESATVSSCKWGRMMRYELVRVGLDERGLVGGGRIWFWAVYRARAFGWRRRWPAGACCGGQVALER